MDLWKAVLEEDLEKVKQTVMSGCDIHFRDAELKANLLHAAARSGKIDTFKYLASLELDPFDLDRCDQTVLYVACQNGHYEMSVFLASTYSTMKEKRDMYNCGVLHAATEGGNIKLFEYLVANGGLDINAVSYRGRTVLHHACWWIIKKNMYGMVKYIITTYPGLIHKVDEDGYTALHYAAESGVFEIFIMLVDQGMNVYAESNSGQNVLMSACRGYECTLFDNTEIVKYLLRSYPTLIRKTDKDKNTVLHYAAKGKSVKILKLLLEKDHHLDVFTAGKDGWTLFHECCKGGRYDMVKYLITKYPELGTMETTKHETPLLLAARYEKDEVIACLLDNVPTVIDKTLSITSSSEKAVRYLKTFTAQKFFSLKARLKDQEEPAPDEELPSNTGKGHLQKWLDESEFYSRTSTSGISDDLSYVAFSSPSPSLTSLLFDQEKTQPVLSSTTDFLSQSMIRMIIQDKGRAAKETEFALRWLRTRAEEQLAYAHEVFVGYCEEDPMEPILLALVEEEQVSKQDTFDSFKLIIRHRRVSSEGKQIAQMEVKRDLHFSPEERICLQRTLANHSKSLMEKHCNIQIVSASKLKSSGYGTDAATIVEKTCIVLYVPFKGFIPFNEKPFQDKLDDFPVDVREGKFYPYSDPREYHEHLLMGCQIASSYGKCGSLGGFVRLQNNSIGCLTCWHLFMSDASDTDLAEKKFNAEVYQPHDQTLSFGHVVGGALVPGDENNIGVDAALIEIKERFPINGTFPNATSHIAGFSEEVPMEYTSGKIVKSFDEARRKCKVVKYGPKTEHTVGILRLEGASVRKEKFEYSTNHDRREKYELYQQFEIFHLQDKPFSEPGDSGSLVFITSEGEDNYNISALGILVGGTDHDSTIITPIWAVLGQFNLPLELLPFAPITTSTGHQRREAPGQTLVSDVGLLQTNVGILQTEMTNVKSGMVSLGHKFTMLEHNITSAQATTDTKLDTLLKHFGVAQAEVSGTTTATRMEDDDVL